MSEQTLIVVKPDAFARKLTGKILSRFEEKGFIIKELKSYNFSKEKAEEFYSAHNKKPFFSELVSFIISSTVVACILEGENAINTVRLMIGSTRSFDAQPGTIRGDYGLGITENIIHASDSYESFIKESNVIFDRSKFKTHFNYGYKLTLSELLDRIFKNIFLIVIGKFFSPAQVGLYTRAETMNQLPVRNISRSLDKVIFPLFVSINNDNHRLKRVYKKLMQMVVFVVTPILLFLAVLAEPFFRFLFTEKWLPAVPYFQILCITGILYPLHSYNLDILNVKGRSDLFLKLEVVKKLLILIVLVVTIPMGIIELLYGQVLISFLAFFINAHYTGKYINYKAFQQLKDITPIIILAVISFSFVYLIDEYLFLDQIDLLRILSGGFIGGVLYLSSAYFLKFNSLFELFNLIWKK